jgi:hypothetical protein
LPRSGKPSPELFFDNSPVVLFVELHIYNTVVLAGDGGIGRWTAALLFFLDVLAVDPDKATINGANETCALLVD